MTDINDTPILTNEQAPPRPGIAIVEIPIDLEQGQQIVELKVRAPGIVRAAGFWLKNPKVLGSLSMRPQTIAMPLLFVECDPAGEMLERVFLFLPSNAPFTARAGFTIAHCATALSEAGALHVYEIVGAAP